MGASVWRVGVGASADVWEQSCSMHLELQSHTLNQHQMCTCTKRTEGEQQQLLLWKQSENIFPLKLLLPSWPGCLYCSRRDRTLL